VSLSDAAIHGIVHLSPEPVFPVKVATLPDDWTFAAFETSDYPTMIAPYVKAQMQAVYAREKQAAFLLFGVHT
jgi:hypothetical protein